MSSYAWYYNAGNGIYYWTNSYDMSASQFAREVSSIVGRSLSASDVSAASGQSDLNSVERRARQMIYIS